MSSPTNTSPDSLLLVILGPTASGKTGVAIALAQACGGEIISMDSALVYRGMDIGTAKPDLAERQGIAHHLIDIIDPTAKTVDELKKLNLPAGVDITIKI